MKTYNKYYKTKMMELISGRDLIPSLRRKTKYINMMMLMELDLKKNKIVLEVIDSPSKFIQAGFRNVSPAEKIIRKFLWFLQYKCNIAFRANTKALQTELIKNVALRAITRKDTKFYQKARSKYALLHGIINSKGLQQPIFISDNIEYTGDITHLLYLMGRKDEATRLWDFWMKSKFTDADRKKMKKECLKTLHEMIEIK